MNKLVDNSHKYDYTINMKLHELYIKITNFCFGLISLSIGGCFYIICRPNSYIHKMFISLFSIPLLSRKPTEDIILLSYYLPDFLWALSFCCFLSLIIHTKNSHYVAPTVVILLGTVWEILQLFQFITGTGDFIDILLYLAAGVTSVIINFLLNSKGEKT